MPGRELGDHPTAPGRSRNSRLTSGDPGRSPGRDDLLGSTGPTRRPGSPARPVEPPAAGRTRPPVPPLRPVPVAPQTTMAPFQPAPTSARDEDDTPADDALWSSSRGRSATGRPIDAPPAGARSRRPVSDAPSGWAPSPSLPSPPPVERTQPPLERRSPSLDDEPWSTGPTFGRPAAMPPPGASARGTGAPGQGAGGPAAPPYGDWTRPSRSGGEDSGRFPAVDDDRPSERFARLRANAGPETSAIPDREVTRRRAADDAPTGPDLEPAPVTGTIGGRAASRAERQAAEEARQRAQKERAAAQGTAKRSPRRAAVGLVAVAIVALGVLGVYSFASPHTKSAAAQQPAAVATTAPVSAPVPGVSDLPTLNAGPLTTAPATTTPAAPIRLPVTVLNATQINGLAAKVAGVLKGAGWPTSPVGEYGKKDVAASTVYFTQGDENQHQAALQLVQQFPQLQGPVPRFFDLPANAPAGLVVVVTGDWKP